MTIQKFRKMKILSMDLNNGSHLSHGSPVSFSSHTYDFVFFGLNKAGKIDYREVYKKAVEENVDVVLCGYSAYPYKIDFENFRTAVDNASKKLKKKIYLMADIAHIAGLVAGGVHSSPFPYCDIVTTTTHKTLRGPRGGMILTNDEDLIKKVNSAVFPYYQGGPFENVIAAKAQMLIEADTEEFKKYAAKVISNTKLLRDELNSFTGVVASGTENHLFLLNVLDSYGINGLEAQKKLEEIGITTNKNMIPGDTLKPNKTSGLRIGMAAITTREISEKHIKLLAETIHKYLSNVISKQDAIKNVKTIVKHLKKVK